MLAVVCPGQGSQSAGFLSPWLAVDGVGDRLAALAAAVGPVAGADLIAHGTTSDAQTIRDTAVAQPLIVAAGLAVAGALWESAGLDERAGALPGVGAVAGHSVGELTAAALAGVLTPREAVVLVRERGAAMAEAAAVTATGMSAVVGGAPEQVEEAVRRSGAVVANRNGAGQVVAAGTLEQMAALAADPPPRARVVPLAVAGAFHTAHMAPAARVLAARAGEASPADPATPLLSNADGAVVAGGRDALDRIVAQVSRPVRWDACSSTLAELGVTALLELTPAGTLAGLAKRALPGVEVVALRTPDDLPAARDLLARTPNPTGSPA